MQRNYFGRLNTNVSTLLVGPLPAALAVINSQPSAPSSLAFFWLTLYSNLYSHCVRVCAHPTVNRTPRINAKANSLFFMFSVYRPQRFKA